MKTISQINSLSREQFVSMIGPVFEHSPWIAETAWSKSPFLNLEQLHQALCHSVKSASDAEQVDLIKAHPDLVGRAALAGTLTSESTREQQSAGLSNLSPDEIELFKNFNQSYREKFEFPFVICARLNKKEAILRGFTERLKNSRDAEVKTALEEIFKIAYLRLQDIVSS